MKLTSFMWLVTSCAAAVAATEEQPNKPVAVQPGGKLIVEVDSGAILVTTNATGKVLAEVRRREHSVSFAQEGSNVTVRSPLKDRPGALPEQSQSEAIYILSVPGLFGVQLSNASNDDIIVSNVTGTVKVASNGGGLRFTSLLGPLDGETEGGGIQVNDCQGDLELRTRGGAIQVAGGGGSLKAETSAVIHVEDFHGNVKVKNGDSVMELEKILGKIEAENGRGTILVVLPSPLPDDVRLSSSGGDVTVSIPENAAFTLDADTAGGALKSDFTLVGSKKERDHVKGTVNGGGKSVVLRTSGGATHLKKLPDQHR